MSKKLTWYDLNAMEAMDVLRKGRNAKASDYRTLDENSIKLLNDKLEKIYKKELGPLSEKQFKDIYEKTLKEVEKEYKTSGLSNGDKFKTTWYDLQNNKADKTLNENFKASKISIKDWDGLKLTAEQARDAEKKLQETLETAIKRGADKEVIGNIFNAWKLQNERAEKFEQALYKSDKTDIMQDYAARQKENVQKGMSLFRRTVHEYNEDFKAGKIQSKDVFTQKIGEANLEITNVYNKAEQDISNRLKNAFGTKDLSSFEKVSPERMNGWVKAMDVADEYASKALGANSKVNQQRLAQIEKTLDVANIKKQEVVNQYKKEVEALKKEVDFKSKLINENYKGGFKKDYLTIKLSSDAEKSLNTARANLKQKIGEIDMATLKNVEKINNTAFKIDKINKFIGTINKSVLNLGRAAKDFVLSPFRAMKQSIETADKNNMSILSNSSKKITEMAKNSIQQNQKER